MKPFTNTSTVPSTMHIQRRLFALLPLGLACLALPACKPKTQPAPESAPVSVQYAVALPADKNTGSTGATFLGLVRGDTETLLSFKVPGQIVAIGREGETDDWREGSLIEKGTLLAKLDPADYINAVKAAKARAEYTRSAFTRYAELYAAANLSKNEFDGARAQKETAEAELAHAEQNLRDTELRAPYSGVLLLRTAKKGEVTGAGRPVLKIGDFQRVAIEVGVPETLLADIFVNQNYPVKLTAFPSETFDGSISEIGSAAAEGSRLFRVILKVPNPDGRLKSGMTASVRLGHSSTPAAGSVIIPLSALFSDKHDSGVRVYVVGGDHVARKREIHTSDLVASSVVVTSGLQAGEKVVTVGIAQLHDGAKVAEAPAKQE